MAAERNMTLDYVAIWHASHDRAIRVSRDTLIRAGFFVYKLAWNGHLVRSLGDLGRYTRAGFFLEGEYLSPTTWEPGD